jgi:PhnB protein
MAAKTQKLVVPYLTVSSGVGAIAFYKKGLGAKEIMRMPGQDGKRLMHAELEINGHALYLSDDFPEMSGEHTGGGRTPEKLGGTPCAVFVQLNKAGAKVTMPAADQFWGDRFGMIVDPFGHAWSFGAPLPKPAKAPAKKKAKGK